MAYTQLQIANLALDVIQQLPITNLAATTDPAAVVLTREWDAAFEEFLGEAFWNWAKRRATLSQTLTETNGAFLMPAVDATVNVTVDSTIDFVVGDNVIVNGVNEMSVASITSATVMVLTNEGGDDNVDPGTSVADNSDIYRRPAFGWAYVYALPTDFVSIVGLNETYSCTPSDLYELEGGLLLTDETEANLEYIRKPTDATSLTNMLADIDGKAVTAFSMLLAAKIAPHLKQDGRATADQVMQRYLTVDLPRARTRNGNQNRPSPRFPSQTSTMLRSRFTFTNR